MFYDSVILTGLSKLVVLIGRFWSGSVIGAALRWLGRKLGQLFSASGIFAFIGREGRGEAAWEKSRLFRFCEWLLALPSTLLGGPFNRTRRIFEASLAYAVLNYLLGKLHIFIALFIFLVLVVPHNFWDNRYNTAAMLLLLFLFVVRTITDSRVKFYVKAFDLFLFIFLLSVVLAEVLSLYPGLSLRFLAFYATSFLLVLLLASTVKTSEQLANVIEIILIGLTISGLYGIWQEIKGVPLIPSQVDTNLNEGMLGRIYSTLDNPNNYAEVLIMLLPFYAAVLFYSKGIVKKLLFLAFAVPSLVALFLTGSRSSWIGFALAVLVFTFIKKKAVVPLLIVLGILMIPFLPQSIYRRLMTIFNPTGDTSAMYRIDIYRTVLPMLKDYWVTGLGLGNDVFMKINQNYYQYTTKVPIHAHNVFLQVWFETGLIGILSFTGYVLGLIKKCFKAVKKAADPVAANMLAAGAASITGILVVSLFEYVWFYPRTMLVFWAVAGLATAALKLAYQQESNAQS